MSEQSPTRFLPVEVFRRQHELGRTPIYDALRRGEVPHVRIGRKILIPENALELMLSRVTVAGAQTEGGDHEAA